MPTGRGLGTGVSAILLVAIAACAGSATSAVSKAAPESAVQSPASTTAASTPARAQATSSTESAKLGIVNCTGEFAVKPRELIFTCADEGDMLYDIIWTDWDFDHAMGAGIEAINDCVPSCAEGQTHTFTATVALANPQPLPDGSGFQYMQAIVKSGTASQPRVFNL